MLKITDVSILPIIKYSCIIFALLQFWFFKNSFRLVINSEGLPDTTYTNYDEPLQTISTVSLKNVDTIRSFDMDEEYNKSKTSPDRPFPPPTNMSLAEKNLFLNFHQKREYPINLEPILPNKTSTIPNSSIHLLLIIKSVCSVKNEVSRNSIRKTWAKSTHIITRKSEVTVDRVFSLGNCKLERAQTQLASEHAIHNDILQWGFVDSYCNLTLKVVGQLAYVHRKRPEITHIFAGDDDVFVNTKGIIDLIESETPSNRQNIFKGSVTAAGRVMRDPQNKMYVPDWLFTDTRYPEYTGGGGFLYSKNIADELLWASFDTKMLNMEDAFVGLLLKKTGRRPVLDDRFVMRHCMKSKSMEKLKLAERGCYWSEILLYHKLTISQLLEVWNVYENLENCQNEMKRHKPLCGNKIVTL